MSTVEYASPPVAGRPTLLQRLNLRILVFLAVIGAPIGWIVYQYVAASLNGGVHQTSQGAEVDLKALGNFPFDDHVGTAAAIPAQWRQLDGKKVILEGFMYAGMSAADTINNFQFVYNIQKCCFGGPPRVQERVFVTVPNGGAVPYYGELVRCSGTLHVGIHKNGAGVIDTLYTMDLQDAKPL
jgi:hypothetical protein